MMDACLLYPAKFVKPLSTLSQVGSNKDGENFVRIGVKEKGRKMVNLYTVLFAKNRYTNLLRVCEGLKAKNISAISLAKLSGEIRLNM